MFQFHSNNYAAPPAWQVDASSQQSNRDLIPPPRERAVNFPTASERNVVAYNDPAAMKSARGENPNLHMSNDLPMEVVTAPTTLDEVYQGSMKSILKSNTGNCILATFLVGTQNLVTWDGVLFDVGNDYMTIYQDDVDRYVIGDIYSLKFVEFFNRQGETCAKPSKTTPQVW